MKQFSSSSVRSLLGNSFVAGLAASTLLVGVVWTTSFATEGNGTGTDTTLPTDVPSSDTATVDSTPADSSTPDSLPDDHSDGTTNDSGSQSNTGADTAALADLAARVATLENTVAALQTALTQANAIVAEFESRTAQLDASGHYTGTISPTQISPRLTPANISGSWPLDRTDGELPIARISTGFMNCRSDSRSYGVITVGAFRTLECERIAK